MATKVIQGLERPGSVWVKHPMLPFGLIALFSLDTTRLSRIKLTDHPQVRTDSPVLVTTIPILHFDPYTSIPSTLSKPFLGAQAGPSIYPPGPSTGRVASAQ